MIIFVLLFLKSDVFLIQYQIFMQVVTSKMQPFMLGVGKISHKYVILWQTLFFFQIQTLMVCALVDFCPVCLKISAL